MEQNQPASTPGRRRTTPKEATLDEILAVVTPLIDRLQMLEAALTELTQSHLKLTTQVGRLVSVVSESSDKNQELVPLVDKVRELLENLPDKLEQIGQVGANRLILALVKALVVDRKEQERLSQRVAIEEELFGKLTPQPSTNGETLIEAFGRGIRGK